MTVQEIIDTLSKLPEDKRDLPVIAVCGSSGVSYEMSSCGRVCKREKWEDCGALDDMKVGEKYVRFSI